MRPPEDLTDGDVLPRRVAVLSVHTSPLAQPGTGDAGGMNVYVVETAKRIAAAGIAVEIDEATGLATAVAPLRLGGSLTEVLPAFWS